MHDSEAEESSSSTATLASARSQSQSQSQHPSLLGSVHADLLSQAHRISADLRTLHGISRTGLNGGLVDDKKYLVRLISMQSKSGNESPFKGIENPLSLTHPVSETSHTYFCSEFFDMPIKGITHAPADAYTVNELSDALVNYLDTFSWTSTRHSRTGTVSSQARRPIEWARSWRRSSPGHRGVQPPVTALRPESVDIDWVWA